MLLARIVPWSTVHAVCDRSLSFGRQLTVQPLSVLPSNNDANPSSSAEEDTGVNKRTTVQRLFCWNMLIGSPLRWKVNGLPRSAEDVERPLREAPSLRRGGRGIIRRHVGVDGLNLGCGPAAVGQDQVKLSIGKGGSHHLPRQRPGEEARLADLQPRPG